MKTKSLKVSEKNWKKLMKWRIDLQCKNIDELIGRLMDIKYVWDLNNKSTDKIKPSLTKTAKKGWFKKK